MTALHPFQERVVTETEAALASGDKVILVAPTGSGKTVMGAAIAKHAAEQHRGVLFLAHRREIIVQTSRKLRAYGVRHGVIIAGADDRLRPMECVQVASVATLWSRGMRSDAMPMPAADLIIVDECHHAPAHTYSKIIEHYPDAKLLGLTATPCRGDGRGLGGHFTKIVEAPQTADLIVEGHLVRSRVYAPVRPNLQGVHTRHGDYVEVELAGRMDVPKLVGDLVSHWLKFGERRRTVVFAVNVAHSLHICTEFQSCGIRAEHLDGGTKLDEREAILARLASGETEVVTNCMVLTEGWDCPEVGCCVLARPTKKMGLFRQMVGRVLRPAEGKADAIVLDHSGAVYCHGLPEDPVVWTLDPDQLAVSPEHAKRSERSVTALIECTQCSHAHGRQALLGVRVHAEASGTRCLLRRWQSLARIGRGSGILLDRGTHRLLCRASSNRARSETQVRVGGAPVSRTVRIIPALGMERLPREGADPRDVGLGQVATDRLRQGAAA